MLMLFTGMWGLAQHAMQKTGLIPAVEGFDYLDFALYLFAHDIRQIQEQLEALRVALNRAYAVVEPRRWYWLRLESIGYTLVAAFASRRHMPARVRAFLAITLPLLRPVLLFVVVTHVIGSFQLFGQVFVLTGGGPGDATRTVVQHLYETAFQNFFQFGSASAMAWVLFAVILAFSLLQFRLLRGHTEY